MDYTNRPQNNMQPATPNFETLADVYGVVGGPAPGSSTAGTSTGPRPVTTQAPPQERDHEDDDEEDEDDRRLRQKTESEHGVARGDFPLSVRQRMEEVDAVVRQGGLAGPGRRLLHESPHGRALEMDLGEGFKVQLHFLLA